MESRASVRALGMLSGLFILVGGVILVGGASAGCGSGSDEPAASAPESSPGSNAAAPMASGRAPEVSPAPAPSAMMPAQRAAALPEDDDPVAPDDAATVDACAALSGSDACGACVCASCRSDLEACSSVEGCAEILVCVRESACPCLGVVLAAPGGKAPALTDPSAGPASDAALRVSDCAQTDDACRGVCGLGD